MRPTLLPVLSALSLLAPFAPIVRAQEPIDEVAVASIRKHGLEQSQVMDLLSMICDVHGPRLTNSPNMKGAQAWARETLAGWDLANAHLEEWGPFGLGWRQERFAMNVVGQNPWPVIAHAKAWSPGTGGAKRAQVVYFNPADGEDLAAWRGKLKGKIVLIQEPRATEEAFEPDATRRDAQDLLDLANAPGPSNAQQPGRRGRDESWRERMRVQQERTNFVYGEAPLAILDRGSKGDYGTIFVSSASVPAPADADFGSRPRAWDPQGVKVIPQFTLAVEHYNRLVRLLDKRRTVEMEVDLAVSFDDSTAMGRNVIAEIPGTDPEIGDQVVMLGAHYDSWHAGTGSTDNGAGSAVMMEAMRILKAMYAETGIRPRRTIRVALWSGEEQGLLGSRAYVGEHFGTSEDRGAPPAQPNAAHRALSAYYNFDNGTGKIRGVYLQGNAGVAPIFRAWLAPFKDLDADTLSLSNTGGTDHQSFDAVNLPGFQFIQDEIAYNARTHHSNMDLWDHSIGDDLQQAATIIASFVHHTAQRDELLPRKPVPAAVAAQPASATGSR
ncbi:MAG TPA: M28 family peptidase [Planctomycetota bacterium]